MILKIFYQSVFSYKIFNYKSTHGGVLIRFEDYVKYVEPDRTADNHAALVLPKLFIKPATLQQVVESVGWISATVEGIVNNTDDKTGRDGYYLQALQATLVLIKNFSGEELQKMAEHIAKIVSNVFKCEDELKFKP